MARRISAAFAIKWRFSMLVASSNVRVREQSGRYLLLLSSSQFEPLRTFRTAAKIAF